MLDDIKKTLWASSDKLRANMDAAEYKHLVLGLIFVKYISDALTLIFGRNWGGWGMRSEPNKKETSAPVTAARSGRGSSEAYRLILR